MRSKLTQIRVSPRWHPKGGVINITLYPFYIAQVEVVMWNPNQCLIIIGFLILVLAVAPFFLIALGLGWAWRGMAAVPHRLTVSLRPPIAR